VKLAPIQGRAHGAGGAQVTDAVEPHPLLYMSVKHVQLDFWRYSAFNPCLGIGRHAQIVEVECQREYEGKGAHPNCVPALGPARGLPRAPAALCGPLIPAGAAACAQISARV
jgi:hypothetical protein